MRQELIMYTLTRFLMEKFSTLVRGVTARIDEHERETRSYCTCKKCCIIRQLWEEGHPIQKRIVYETFKEYEALERENILIQNEIYTQL